MSLEEIRSDTKNKVIIKSHGTDVLCLLSIVDEYSFRSGIHLAEEDLTELFLGNFWDILGLSDTSTYQDVLSKLPEGAQMYARFLTQAGNRVYH